MRNSDTVENGPGAAAASVYAAFLQSVQQFPQRSFLRAPAASVADYSDAAIEISYQDAVSMVDRLVAAYIAEGVTPTDRVVVCFDSRLDVYLHLLALNAVGASIVPIVSAAGDNELLHIIGHSDSRLLITMPEQRQRLRELVADYDCRVLSPADMKRGQPDNVLPAASRSVEAAMLYTSGTTGKPKGCMLSNEYFLAIGEWYVGLGGLCALDENDRLLTPLPPNHMNALCTSFMAMLLCGGCVVQVDRFHPRSWWQTVRDEGATVIHCLGVMTAILLTLPEEASDGDNGSVKFCFGPGSNPKHQGAFESRFGIPLVEAWAMTETGAGAMTIADKEPRHVGQRCIGKPDRNMEYRIVDSDDKDVALGTAGELIVRAVGDDPRKRFFSGYYKDAAATEEGWRGGWWHTGDVVRAGEDGNLFFVDRSKNIIRRSGENVAAVEVEGVLLAHKRVLNCAVCAVPDEIRGDEVFAFVVVDNKAQQDGGVEAALFDYCMEKLSYFKVPAYISCVETLPLTASQKVSRGEVKTLARASMKSGQYSDFAAMKKRQR